MSKTPNLEDQFFGKLIVIDRERDPEYIIKGSATWYCLCDCGRFKRASTHQLLAGITRHCGCVQSRLNLTGNRYNKLTALFPGQHIENTRSATTWICQCDCGRYRRIHTSVLQSGKAKSCGHCDGRRHRKSKEVFEHIEGVCRI